MIHSLNIIDLLFIAIFFFSVLIGLLRGLVREILSIIFLVAAVAVAFIFYQDVGLLLNGLIKKRELADLAGFLLLLLAGGSAGALLSTLIGKLVVVGPLKALDRLLGGAFGMLRAALLSAIIIYGFIAFPLNDQLLKESKTAPYLIGAMKTVMRFLPPALRDKLKLITIYDYKKNNRNSRTI